MRRQTEPPQTAPAAGHGLSQTIQCWVRRLLLFGSCFLFLGTVSCFIGRWDEVAVVTLPPFWAWAVPGVLLCVLAQRLGGGWASKCLGTIWLAAVLVLSDDFSGLFWPVCKQALGYGPKADAWPRVRVISLNCASQATALDETRAWEPDILLLQESPSSNDVARICREFFGPSGSFLYGFDCSIVTRGRIEVLAVPRSLRFVRGLVRLSDQVSLDVVSLRLLPPDTRLDLWSPECWRQHTNGRKLRRAQLGEVLDGLELSIRRPMIVGGDFNAPAGDRIFRPMRAFLKDCFREAGRGWGNTAINTFPIARPDQLWVDYSTSVLRAWVAKTENSDHRMVICDIVPAEAAKEAAK